MLMSCQESKEEKNLFELLTDIESIDGKSEYLNSPYVTAGDRLYTVGHQNGTFPDHGWHVPGEMGGIWDHPIKLMDGFLITVSTEDTVWPLNSANKFTNYPVGNVMTFENRSLGLVVKKLQFVPDQMEGMVISLEIENTSTSKAEFDLFFEPSIDLMPVWLTERLDMENEEDTIIWQTEGFFIGKDKNNPWFVAYGGDEGTPNDQNIKKTLQVPPGDKQYIDYFIAGSYRSKAQVVDTWKTLKANSLALLETKIKRYEQIDKYSKVSIPDKDLETMYEWTKYNTDWLIRDVDTLGRALSAGMADYPWWFGADNCYSLQGLLATGQHQEVLETVSLLVKLSKQANGNSGQIIHEASTNGIVFNPGNLNETPHFVYLLWKIFEWTGDEEWLRSYYPLAKASMEWILAQDHDDNLYADGPGMMEIPGLHSEMVDVVVYTQQGAEALANMAGFLEDSEVAEKYKKIASTLKQKINSEWWSEEAASYADFRAEKTKTLALIDAAIIRSDTINKPWAVEELKATRKKVMQQKPGIRSQVVYHNWVVNTPMELGIADPEKAIKALATGRQYRSKYGTYVTGLDRDESVDESTKWEVFSYVGAVMTLPTGVQAIAENNYNQPDEAYEYLKQLTNSFSYALPGSTYEVSPDYGMMTQAWTIYSLAVPIVNQFFGFQPEAYNKTLNLSPKFPSDWEDASINNVKVGENSFSLSMKREQQEITYTITQTGDWEIIFQTDGLSEPVSFSDNQKVVKVSL